MVRAAVFFYTGHIVCDNQPRGSFFRIEMKATFCGLSRGRGFLLAGGARRAGGYFSGGHVSCFYKESLE